MSKLFYWCTLLIVILYHNLRIQLQSLLSDKELGVTAAQCYSVLLSDHAYAFVTSSSSNVRYAVYQRQVYGMPGMAVFSSHTRNALAFRRGPQTLDSITSYLASHPQAHTVFHIHQVFILNSGKYFAIVLRTLYSSGYCTISAVFVRLLYKQRTFEGLVTSLVSEFDVSSGKTRRCCLLAIASLLPHVPQPLLQHHIDKVNVLWILCDERCSGMTFCCRSHIFFLSDALLGADVEHQLGLIHSRLRLIDWLIHSLNGRGWTWLPD
jgi:hypothetical protein